MRILIVSQFYRPEPPEIPTSLAQSFARSGHDVVVVTAFPSRPGGKLYDGYIQRFGWEEADGDVRIIRVPTFISHDQNAYNRIVSFLSFAAASMLESKWARKADVVYVYGTPMTAAVGPRIWKTLFGTRLVVHIQDLWPESVTQSGMIPAGLPLRLAEAVLNGMLRWLYSGIDHTIAIAPTMTRKLVQRGIDQDKIDTVLNWGTHVSKRRIRPESDHPKLQIVYAGNIGPFQDIETILEAGRLLSDLSNAHIDIYGDGINHEKVRSLAEGMPNVTVHGRISRAELDQVYDKCDFQLVTLKDYKIFEGTIPSKFQDSMAAGIPVICTVRGDMQSIVTDNGVGFVADPEDPVSLAAAIRKAYQMSGVERRAAGERARAYYDGHMSYSRSGARVESIVRRVGELGYYHRSVNGPLASEDEVGSV